MRVVRLVSISLLLVLVFNMISGCTNKNHNETDLFQNINKNDIVAPFNIDSTCKDAAMNFGVELLKSQYRDNNILISPYSVLNSLLMVANGAEGITKDEFEAVFHMTIEEANEYVLFVSSKSSQNSYSVNAIWINDKGEIEFDKEYLQIMSDYFNSNVFYETFDKKTNDNINNFVKESTKEMIPEVIDSIKVDSPMVLVNTQYFAGLWANEFSEDMTKIDTFTNLDNSTSDVSFMNQEVTNCYIQVNNGFGVVLRYQSGMFIAVRPDFNTEFDDFLEGLNGDEIIKSIYKRPSGTYITNLKLPKFNMDYETTLNDAIKEMGLNSAFDNSANLDGMTISKNNLFIENIIHKTTIKVDEKGTVAAAATVVELGGMASNITNFKRNEVIFNKPFVYIITDNYGTPLFMGIITNLD